MNQTESPAATPAGSNLPTLSVGELSAALRTTVERAFPLVRVRGEISGFKRAASGHLYFTLKDTEAVIDAVCWRGTAGRLALAPEDGLDVIAQGRITTYGGRSKYQIVVESIELAGQGALLKLLEDRRKRLADEGLFDAGRKKPLPYLPEVIGVVTSPTGSVIRDILHRLADRFPRHVLVWPVAVQGDAAERQIVEAIAGFNRLVPGDATLPRPDLLIVARGGGSLEDLWAFNEEAVVRAAAASEIPLISAVGHETDVTLIDFAADRRAPTPTAAAEMAVPVRLDLMSQTRDLGSRLSAGVSRHLQSSADTLRHLGRRLPDLVRLTEQKTQRLDDWSERLRQSLKIGLERRQTRYDHARMRIPPAEARLVTLGERTVALHERTTRAVQSRIRDAERTLKGTERLLQSCSYVSVLERGFALVLERETGTLLKSGEQAARAGALRIRFGENDEIDADVGDAAGGSRTPAVTPKAKPASARPAKRPGNGGGAGGNQGSLF